MKKSPQHLHPDTRRWWRETVEEYAFEPHQVRLLTLAGESWDRCRQARELIATEGIVVEDRYGSPKAHPAVAIERDSRLAFARLVRELALETDSLPGPRPPRIGGGR